MVRQLLSTPPLSWTQRVKCLYCRRRRESLSQDVWVNQCSRGRFLSIVCCRLSIWSHQPLAPLGKPFHDGREFFSRTWGGQFVFFLQGGSSDLSIMCLAREWILAPPVFLARKSPSFSRLSIWSGHSARSSWQSKAKPPVSSPLF